MLPLRRRASWPSSFSLCSGDLHRALLISSRFLRCRKRHKNSIRQVFWSALAGRFFVHPDYAGRLLAVFYLRGLGSTTYMIGASLVLLEKSGGTLQALRITPLTSTPGDLSKTLITARTMMPPTPPCCSRMMRCW